MPEVFGIEDQTLVTLGDDGTLSKTIPAIPVNTSAEKLGEAIADYEKERGAIVTPYDGSHPEIPFEEGEPPRYFFYTFSKSSRFHGQTDIVDIHIFRGDEEICPKQDLEFKLLPYDIVHIGVHRAC